jgi:hypothetical protein
MGKSNQSRKNVELWFRNGAPMSMGDCLTQLDPCWFNVVDTGMPTREVGIDLGGIACLMWSVLDKQYPVRGTNDSLRSGDLVVLPPEQLVYLVADSPSQPAPQAWLAFGDHQYVVPLGVNHATINLCVCSLPVTRSEAGCR